MSRLTMITSDRAQTTMEGLYKDLERRIAASPTGLCPVDMAAAFLKMCHAQTCGKCVPCRVGLGQLAHMLDQVLDGNAPADILPKIEKTAQAIYLSADCAIGFEAADMVLKGLAGFRDDYEEHVKNGRCLCEIHQPVPCVAQCPANVDVPGYIALISHGRYADAIRLIRKDNPMPSACAYICEHPCENRCRRNMVDAAINIRGLKRYAVDHAGDVPVPANAPATGKKVAVVGGGPSGLSAAYYLALMGHQVTIFDKHKKLGGMLRYGIPNYRFPRDILDQEIASILSTGIEVKTESVIGKGAGTLVNLKKKYDAIYIAIGAQTDKKLHIAGADTKGVMSAVEFLGQIGDDIIPDYTGKDVIVVGGGNVAMDVARSLIRFKAKSVAIVYRRRKKDMTAQLEEIDAAENEGCKLLELNAPVRIEANAQGEVAALWVQPQMISKVSGGRPSPVKAEEGEKRIVCDNIIMAVGQGIETKNFEEGAIHVVKGVIEAMQDGDVRTMSGVYAGGDCVTAPATAIRAIAAGKVAAANIDEYLGFNHPIEIDVDIPVVRHERVDPCGRINLKQRDADERKQDNELAELGMTDQECQQESRRCLRCDYFGFGCFKGGRETQW